MRILLIDPPFKVFTGYANNFFPIGLAILAAVLTKEGHEVKVLEVDKITMTNDINYSDEYKRLQLYVDGINNDHHHIWGDIKKYLEEFRPDVIGLTVMTQKLGAAVKLAQICKEWDSNVPVIVGGAHPTLDPEQVLSSKDIDFAVRGEGELVLPQLLKAIAAKSGFSGIGSLSYKKDGQVVNNPICALIEDLDIVPLPARELLMNAHNYSSEDMGVIMTTRGCPYGCTYCFHMWARRVRYRSIDSVIKEIKLVKTNYGTRQFAFKDDTFTINRKRLFDLLQRMIDEKLNINWECTTRVDVLDEEMLKKMIEAGCNVVKIGVETGSAKILKETNKGVTMEQIKKAAALLNKYNVFWSAYFMMGLPQETEDDIRSTYTFMKELNPYYAGLGVYNPMPETELYEMGVKMGLLYEKVGLDHFFKVNPKDMYFKDPKKRVAQIDNEKFEKLANFMMDAFHKHNTKMINLVRRGWARRRAYRSEPKMLASDIRKVIKWVVKV